MTEHENNRPIVVVGIDGSPNSAAALRWAGNYAQLTGAELHLVLVWQSITGFGYAPISSDEFEREGQRTLTRTIDTALGENPSLPISTKIVNGNPAAVLIEESREADLVVVGDRGYEGFAGLLLGHVGENCARNAHCSVIIVRTPR